MDGLSKSILDWSSEKFCSCAWGIFNKCLRVYFDCIPTYRGKEKDRQREGNRKENKFERERERDRSGGAGRIMSNLRPQFVRTDRKSCEFSRQRNERRESLRPFVCVSVRACANTQRIAERESFSNLLIEYRHL